MTASNVVQLHRTRTGLIRACDVRTLRALAQYEGREGEEARAELRRRGEPRAAVEIAESMLGHADRITVLLGGGPAADAILARASEGGRI